MSCPGNSITQHSVGVNVEVIAAENYRVIVVVADAFVMVVVVANYNVVGFFDA